MPLLWAIPLGLYLLSFIMVFARWPILKWLWLLRIFQAAGLAARGGHDLPWRAGNRRHRGRRRAALGGLLSHGAGMSRGDGRRPPGEQAPDRVLPLDVGRRRRRRPDLRAGGPAGLQQRAGVPADARRGMPAASAAAIEPIRTVLAVVRPGADAGARRRLRLCRFAPSGKDALPAWPRIGVRSR